MDSNKKNSLFEILHQVTSMSSLCFFSLLTYALPVSTFVADVFEEVVVQDGIATDLTEAKHSIGYIVCLPTPFKGASIEFFYQGRGHLHQSLPDGTQLRYPAG